MSWTRLDDGAVGASLTSRRSVALDGLTDAQGQRPDDAAVVVARQEMCGLARLVDVLSGPRKVARALQRFRDHVPLAISA